MVTNPSFWNAFGFMSSLLLALCCALFLRTENMTYAFVVLGQAHFLLAYLYQWRAGKIGLAYALWYAAAFGALVFAFVTIPDPGVWSLALAGTIFAIHFFVDEMHINGIPLTGETRLLGFAFIFLYGMLLLRSAYDIDEPILVGGIALAACIPLIYSRLESRSIRAAEMFFLSAIGILLLIIYVPWSILLTTTLGFIVLFHVFRWYFFYFFKLNENPDKTKLRRYLIDVAVVNGLTFALFALYLLYPAFRMLEYAFLPTYYYLWAMLHVAFSARLPQWLTSRFQRQPL